MVLAGLKSRRHRAWCDVFGGLNVRTKILAALAILGANTPVLAADFETPPAPSGVRSPAAIVYSWTGVYLGIHAGGGWSNLAGTDPTLPNDPWVSASASGAIAGGQLGFNYQIGNVVLGAEGAYAWSNVGVSDGGPFAGGPGLTVKIRNDYVATAAGRIGYAFDRVLLFAKGGGAWTRDKLDANDGIGGTATGQFNRSGWMAGAGVEYAFLQNWSVKAEYDYLRFAGINEVPTTAGGLGATPALVKLDMQMVLLGLNYRF
jgi:outer membrane immunogenic protein